MDVTILTKNSIGHDTTVIKNLGEIVEISFDQLFDANEHEWDCVQVKLPIQMYVEGVSRIVNGEKEVNLKQEDGKKYFGLVNYGNHISIDAGYGCGNICSYSNFIPTPIFMSEFSKVVENYKS